jgi:pyruvate-ferredoxin/flavodoxin oxidoreductase
MKLPGQKEEVMNKKKQTFKYPGVRVAVDGNTAAIMCERESSDAAGAYPITLLHKWENTGRKKPPRDTSIFRIAHSSSSSRKESMPLLLLRQGLSMTGLRAANFSSGQGIAYMHESLYAAVGKRLTYVLGISAPGP